MNKSKCLCSISAASVFLLLVVGCALRPLTQVTEIQSTQAQEIQITKDQENPAISSDMVVWQDFLTEIGTSTCMTWLK